jgi:hypothetical protein
MSKMRQRKRLSIAALAFLLVFLAGAAFAFVPGMLDVVGRVGIREGDYVRWILAATQGPVERDVTDSTEDPLTPGIFRSGFTHDMMANVRTSAVHGDPEISDIYPDVYLSHAVILPTTRGRQSQRIEWSVVFQGPTTARLYVQAMNYSELNDANITSARVVDLTNFGPVGPTLGTGAGGMGWSDGGPIADVTPAHTLPVSAEDLGGMFNVTLTGLGTLPILLEANDTTFTNDDSSTDVFYIDVEWTGELPDMPEADDIVRWQWVETDTTADGASIGSWVELGETSPYSGLTPPDAFGVADGDIYMAVVTAAGVAIPLNDLTPWIGTFVVELDYELA